MHSLPLSDDARVAILTSEASLIQDRIFKYEELVWKSRGWAVALTVALTGWAVANFEKTQAGPLLLLASCVPVFFWIEEGILRTVYLAKYIDRYRLIRSQLNDTKDEFCGPIYDLTAHIQGRTPAATRFRHSFFRIEGIVFYSLLCAIPAGVMLILPPPDPQPCQAAAQAAESYQTGLDWSRGTEPFWRGDEK